MCSLSTFLSCSPTDPPISTQQWGQLTRLEQLCGSWPITNKQVLELQLRKWNIISIRALTAQNNHGNKQEKKNLQLWWWIPGWEEEKRSWEVCRKNPGYSHSRIRGTNVNFFFLINIWGNISLLTVFDLSTPLIIVQRD